MSSPVLCAVDIETTGLNFETDAILELGWVIKRWGDRRAFRIKNHYVFTDKEISEEITKITGITNGLLGARSIPFFSAFEDFVGNLVNEKVNFIVTHNGTIFDIPFILQKKKYSCISDETFEMTPKLDTICDIKYPADCTARNLMYLAAYHGFVNPFPHSAVFDAYTTLKILDRYDIQEVIKRAQSPWIVLRAMVLPPFRDNKPEGQKEVDGAKKHGFKYQECGDGKVYEKCWVKRIKEDEFDEEVKSCAFEIRRIGDEQKKA